jgi:ribosomal protein L37AE/L43A
VTHDRCPHCERRGHLVEEIGEHVCSSCGTTWAPRERDAAPPEGPVNEVQRPWAFVMPWGTGGAG